VEPTTRALSSLDLTPRALFSRRNARPALPRILSSATVAVNAVHGQGICSATTTCRRKEKAGWKKLHPAGKMSFGLSSPFAPEES